MKGGKFSEFIEIRILVAMEDTSTKIFAAKSAGIKALMNLMK